jgi:hypothetical protein
MAISKTLTGTQSQDPTLFAVDTLANLSPSQESEKEKMTIGTCGRLSTTPLSIYDPVTQSWKMLQLTFPWDSDKFSETWPKSGMTQNGKSYQLQPWVRLIEETESSLLPTPTCKPIYHPEVPWDGVSRHLLRPGGLKFGISIADVVGGRPNPMFLEWMMGFPLRWTELEDSETP